MSTIVIKDLTDSVELDRQAMQAISGGARLRTVQAFRGQTLFGTAGSVVFPTGSASSMPAEAPAPRHAYPLLPCRKHFP